MSGCFGNHPVDRHLEGQLNRHLDEEDRQQMKCEQCINYDSILCNICDGDKYYKEEE